MYICIYARVSRPFEDLSNDTPELRNMCDTTTEMKAWIRPSRHICKDSIQLRRILHLNVYIRNGFYISVYAYPCKCICICQ